MSRDFSTVVRFGSQSKRNWIGSGLFLVVLLGISASPRSHARQLTSFEGPFQPGGPWSTVTNTPDCASEGKVCAEWPFAQGFVVCCIDPGLVGSATPPNGACDGNLTVRGRDF